MSGSGDLYDALMDRLNDPYVRGRIRRALSMDLVLDTWLNGEREESFSVEAEEIISRATEDFTQQALESGAVFPGNPMPKGYVRSVFQELLSSTALYQAQKYKGVREVDDADATNAEAILRRFVATERDGLTGAAGMYFVISAHEDLNAIHYYHRMKREDFLLGALHRPWSDMMLTNQLDVYRRMGVVGEAFTGGGEKLQLTTRGVGLLELLRGILEESGEFEWRSNAQRWVIFGETDYDAVFNAVALDMERLTREYINQLEIPEGARILEIGAGTGRATFDLGLVARVAEQGGTLVVMEPSAALIHALRNKRLLHGAENVEIVQGMVEDLPFPDKSFDLVVSVFVLHFTDLKKASSEMIRVTKPGGSISAMVPLTFSPFDIPMVALWFRPLKVLADELGVPLGERQGVLPGLTEQEFRAGGMSGLTTDVLLGRASASDHRSFLQLMLKGAALYQNILSRIPFQERWRILRHLEEKGSELVTNTSREEQQVIWSAEVISGTVPFPVPVSASISVEGILSQSHNPPVKQVPRE